MDVEGRLSLTLQVSGGRVSRAVLATSRNPGIVGGLIGKPVAEIAPALSRIFSLCGTAQAVAGVTAAENALGLQGMPGRAAARRLLLLAELAEQDALRLFLDWPRFYGAAPSVGDLVGLRSVLHAIPKQIFPDDDWRGPMAGRMDVDRGLVAKTVERLEGLLSKSLLGHPREGGPALTCFDDLKAWWQRSDTSVAQTLAWVCDQGLATFGRSDVRPLRSLTAGWAEEHLADDRDGEFARQPLFQGAPAETGPMVRLGGTPLVRDLTARFGNGLLTRLSARLIGLLAVPAQMRAALRDLPDGALPGFSGRYEAGTKGTGIAVVECARGLLVHRLEVSGGLVGRYQILAPTEWNFHPEGAIVQGLVGADGQDRDELIRRAGMLVAALDPCVACDTTIEDA